MIACHFGRNERFGRPSLGSLQLLPVVRRLLLDLALRRLASHSCFSHSLLSRQVSDISTNSSSYSGTALRSHPAQRKGRWTKRLPLPALALVPTLVQEGRLADNQSFVPLKTLYSSLPPATTRDSRAQAGIPAASRLRSSNKPLARTSISVGCSLASEERVVKYKGLRLLKVSSWHSTAQQQKGDRVERENRARSVAFVPRRAT